MNNNNNNNTSCVREMKFSDKMRLADKIKPIEKAKAKKRQHAGKKINRAPEPSQRDSQHLYIIRMGDSGPIKIGVAANPHARMEELQTGNPEKLQLVKVFKNCGKYEQEAHKKFRRYRMQGEWFENEALHIFFHGEAWQNM